MSQPPPTLVARFRVPLAAFPLEASFETNARTLGVFGPSGSGKTTLLEALAGLRPQARGYLAGPDGTVWLDSSRRMAAAPEQRRIGYVPQDHLLFPGRSARKNLAFGAARAGKSGGDIATDFAEVIDTLELAPLLDQDVATLSGGERQRVALGRALCSGPGLLLLDEPLAALDAPLRHRILPYLQRTRDRFGIPIVIVSHNATELLALCDEVVVLETGRIIAQGEPAATLSLANVYEAAAADGFQNTLRARVEAHSEHVTRARLHGDAAAPILALAKVDLPTGTELLLGLPARDILLATHPIQGLSARNQLPARVSALEPIGHKRIARIRIEGYRGQPLVAELTSDAVAELNLAPDSQVWLVFKSSSLTPFV